MKPFNDRLLYVNILAFFLNSLLVAAAFSQSNNYNLHEAYYLYISKYPEGAVSWGEKYREVQGITHDNNNWYITATNRMSRFSSDIENCFLWKIPVEEDLNKNVYRNPNVMTVELYDLPLLWNNMDPWSGYIHWGDLDHYNFKGVDYLVVPATSPKLPSPAILVFRCADLTLAGIGILHGEPYFDLIPGGPPLDPQEDVGWCAIDPRNGDLYTSNDLTSKIFCYEMPWEKLPKSGCEKNLPIKHIQTNYLMENNEIIELHNMQGGEFSPSGQLLYISNGRGHCKGKGADDAGHPNDGINVFDTQSWQRIIHSYNRCYAGPYISGCKHPWQFYFDFTYDFDCGKAEFHSDQPQGLTIWDLDNGIAPHISGQLHVLMSAVGIFGNQAALFHFGGRLYVDRINGFKPEWRDPLPGTPCRPFQTIYEAENWYPAWDGAEIVLTTGPCDENPDGGAGASSSGASSSVTVKSRGGGVNEGISFIKTDIPSLANRVPVIHHGFGCGNYWASSEELKDGKVIFNYCKPEEINGGCYCVQNSIKPFGIESISVDNVSDEEIIEVAISKGRSSNYAKLPFRLDNDYHIWATTEEDTKNDYDFTFIVRGRDAVRLVTAEHITVLKGIQPDIVKNEGNALLRKLAIINHYDPNFKILKTPEKNNLKVLVQGSYNGETYLVGLSEDEEYYPIKLGDRQITGRLMQVLAPLGRQLQYPLNELIDEWYDTGRGKSIIACVEGGKPGKYRNPNEAWSSGVQGFSGHYSNQLTYILSDGTILGPNLPEIKVDWYSKVASLENAYLAMIAIVDPEATILEPQSGRKVALVSGDPDSMYLLDVPEGGGKPTVVDFFSNLKPDKKEAYARKIKEDIGWYNENWRDHVEDFQFDH